MAGYVQRTKMLAFTKTFPAHAAAAPMLFYFMLGDNIYPVGCFAFYFKPVGPLITVRQYDTTRQIKCRHVL